MRLEWLEDILAVAETGSFIEAAQRRGLTQSAFSRRIRVIEDHVGRELFDRAQKPVQLHRATGEQRDRIQRLASMLRQLVADLRTRDLTTARRIVIGGQHTFAATIIPQLFQELESRNRGVFLQATLVNFDECFALLLARRIDIAIVNNLPDIELPVSQSFIDAASIGSDRLIPVIGREGPPLPTLPYIAYPSEVFLGQVMQRRILPFLEGGILAISKAETALTLAAIEMAESGLAVAWIPESLARARIAEGRLIDLSSSLPSCGLTITAVRLSSGAHPVLEEVWQQIVSRKSLEFTK